MLSWAIQTTIISLVIIFLIHSIYHYFKETLTIPKVKDLVNKPNEKYEEIYKIINQNNNNGEINYAKSASSDMKEELKIFLNQQVSNPNSIEPGNAVLDDNKFSKYE
jgi:predicted site-specific integrase-resolvase